MPEYQVVCIIKSLPGNHPQHITHIGAIINGVCYSVDRDFAVQLIRSHRCRFYTINPYTQEYILVEMENGLNGPYLRTRPDETVHDNLLYLPDCGTALCTHECVALTQEQIVTLLQNGSV